MRGHALFVLLAGLVASGPAAAQGLGFLFGGPPPRVRRAPRSPPREAALVAVPLPVPRPHFPGDAAPATLPLPDVKVPPPAPAGIAETPAAPVLDTPPLPPERPPQSELASGPAADPKPNVATEVGPAPAASKPEASRSEPALDARGPPPLTVPAPVPPLPPQKPAALETKPAPAVAPSGATTAFNPREPAPDAGCADRLKARGVSAEATVLGSQPDERCTVVQPVRLVSATLLDGSTVSFPDRPTIACITADAFSAYVHDLLAPLAKGTWGTGVASVWTGPGLECRSRDHVFGAKLSAHGQGLAVDIAQLKLGDGRLVAVGDPKTDAERDFEIAARAGGCGYFHTVLGPGSDSYHRTHWHFDLEVRGKDGDGKYCK